MDRGEAMLIHNARLVTWGEPNQLLENQALYIDDGKIVDLGPAEEILSRHPEAEKLDARAQIVMPGNICAHTHFYGAFARGMAIPGRAPKDFPEILTKLWWPLDKALTMEDVRASTLVCLVDAIRHGTTTLIDHHASPFAVTGSLDRIASAVKEVGLRACLCYEVSDRDGDEIAQKGIRENVSFIEKCNSRRDDRHRTFSRKTQMALLEGIAQVFKCHSSCRDQREESSF